MGERILKSSEPFDSEREMADDTFVYGDYLYLAKMGEDDFRVVRSDWHGVPAARLKASLGALAIHRCDMGARGFFG